MRYVVGLCLLALAVPVFAGDPGNPDPAFAQQAWTGKHSDELIASWGKPRKTKRHGEGGKVLVYRLHFYGEGIVGETKTSWSAAGIGTTSNPIPGRRESASFLNTGPELVFAGRPEVIATQKVTFYVDKHGVVQRAEFAPRKWKRKR
jgi:hypothetical protein